MKGEIKYNSDKPQRVERKSAYWASAENQACLFLFRSRLRLKFHANRLATSPGGFGFAGPLAFFPPVSFFPALLFFCAQALGLLKSCTARQVQGLLECTVELVGSAIVLKD